jgi:hypothetical protein
LNSRQYGLLVFIIVAASLIGGVGTAGVILNFSKPVLPQSSESQSPESQLPTQQPPADLTQSKVTEINAEVITAKKFRLVDQAGNLRLGLGITGDGKVGVLFFDKNSRIRLQLGLAPEGDGYLIFHDTDDNVRTVLRESEEFDGKGFVIFDKKGKIVWKAPK